MTLSPSRVTTSSERLLFGIRKITSNSNKNFYKYNNEFFPRDTVEQIKKKGGIKNKNSFKKGDIIFWKGHVAICINSKNLIHAYGPEKKVIIMPIRSTIKRIEKSANLKVKKVFRI